MLQIYILEKSYIYPAKKGYYNFFFKIKQKTISLIYLKLQKTRNSMKVYYIELSVRVRWPNLSITGYIYKNTLNQIKKIKLKKPIFYTSNLWEFQNSSTMKSILHRSEYSGESIFKTPLDGIVVNDMYTSKKNAVSNVYQNPINIQEKIELRHLLMQHSLEEVRGLKNRMNVLWTKLKFPQKCKYICYLIK